MIKVIGFKKLKSGNKKYEITFEKNGKKYIRKFGAAGMSDYTKHKDKSRRERYISRHKKDLRTNDPMKPGYLSMYILWNKPTVKASLADYKRRLNVYNRTGKFPKGITGSKKLSFGTLEIPFEQTSMNVLSGDTQNLVKKHLAAMTIQRPAKTMNAKRSLIDALKIRGYTRYQRAGRDTGNKNFLNKLWTNLDPENEFTSKWFTRAAKVLTKNDFDFKTRNFWWKIVENNIQVMDEMTESGTEDPREYLDEPNRTYYLDTLEALVKILNKTGYNTTLTATYSLDWPANALNWWKSKRTNFGTIIPFDETSLNVLPSDIQRLIQRDVSASDIQRIQRGRNIRKVPRNMMTKKFLKQLLWRMNAEYETPAYANEMMQLGGEPWLVLNPAQRQTSEWLFYAADILTGADFDRDDLWYNCLNHVVDEFVSWNPDNLRIRGETSAILMTSAENIEILLQKIGYYIDTDEPGWYNRANAWLEEYATGNAFGNAFGKKNNLPDNVVNKALYAKIKAKIKKSIKGRRWGAYDSGRLVREYKAKGGKYRGGKGKTDLGRWYKEKWVDACAWPKRKPCGRKTKEKIAYCRPSKKVDSKTPKLVQKLTKAQIKSRCAKKKRSPMRRITKFGNQWRVSQNGNAYSDEIQFPGDANWTIHCSYIKSIDGTHITLRRNDGVAGGDDHSIHYGIPNWAPNGPPQWWATGEYRNYLVQGQTPQIPSEWQNWIINYYNTVCSTLPFPAQIRGPSPYAQTGFPPPSPAPGTGQGFLSSFGNVRSIDFYKHLMKTSSDPSEVTQRLRQQLQLRCGKTGNKLCDNYLTELFLNIFHTIKGQLPKSDRRKQIINIIKPIENQFRLKTGYKYTPLPIKRSDYNKLRVLLGLMQDEVLDYTKDVAYLASAVLAYIS